MGRKEIAGPDVLYFDCRASSFAMNAFFFWLFSAGMIGGGLAVILNRNPVASALCFATSMVFMAALFVMLNAFFLAAVQILVTAGAVMVLFLFIIMLLDVTVAEKAPRQRIRMAGTFLLAAGFVYLVGRVLADTPSGTRTTDSLGNAPTTTQAHLLVKGGGYRTVTLSNDDTHQIGRLLFNRYVAPFEVTSLLILVATIGVVVLCKEDVVSARPAKPAVPPEPKPDPALTR
jgi:NADH-quinone oxidoreductase subunit J